MRIAQINMLTTGSTGKIMFQLAETARAEGDTVRTYAPVPFVRGKKMIPGEIPQHFWWGSRAEQMFHYYMGTLLGMNGLFSRAGTRALIRDLKKFSPDVVHLHNLHGFCVNLPMLFRYLRKSGVRVVWTFHDCWPFTGHCPYFTVSGCVKWQKKCSHCPQPKIYPKMYCDTAGMMYRKKKKWFAGLENLTVVTPSEWLAQLVGKSFFAGHSVRVIPNGIDLSVFYPRGSGFREKYKIGENQFLLLGVSFDWSYRKGLDVFLRLAERLNPEKFRIVLVGTNDRVDAELPESIISVHRTENQAELAGIYSAADLFVNPTREENYPTVNMEAIACGTPVLTFRTGGSPEIPDESTGCVTASNDADAMEREILRIEKERPFTETACLARARNFDRVQRFRQYGELYHQI